MTARRSARAIPVGLGAARETGLHGEDVDATQPGDRHHHAQAEEPAVADDQRTRDWLGEGDLDVPEPLLGESGAWRKRLDALAVALEGLALDPDRLGSRVHLRMPQGLEHRGGRALLFVDAFRSTLGFRRLACWVDPAAAFR